MRLHVSSASGFFFSKWLCANSIYQISRSHQSLKPMLVTLRGHQQHFRTVTFDRARNAVMLIEQRLLPHEFRIDPMFDYRQTARAIQDMVVRGAGAIGATAAYGFAQGALAFHGSDKAGFRRHLARVYETLKSA